MTVSKMIKNFIAAVVPDPEVPYRAIKALHVSVVPNNPSVHTGCRPVWTMDKIRKQINKSMVSWNVVHTHFLSADIINGHSPLSC